MSIGATGVISVAANVVPRLLADMTGAWLEGDPATAKKLHFELFPLFKALFIETNPIPVKAAVAALGKIKEQYRLPLCPMAAPNREKLLGVMRDMKLI